MPVTFTCPHCGHTTEVADTYVGQTGPCVQCGKMVTVQGPSNPFSDSPSAKRVPQHPPRSLGEDAAARWLLPVGRSTWAIVAGYAGLLSLGCFPLGFVGVICGVVAIRDIRQHPNRHGMGRAIFGIVTGIVGSLMTVGLLVAFVMNER